MGYKYGQGVKRMRLNTYVDFVMRELGGYVEQGMPIEFDLPVILKSGEPMIYGEKIEERQGKMAQFDVPAECCGRIRFTCKQIFIG